MSDSAYILGDDDGELDRLRLQHKVWRAATQRILDLASFARGDALLDVGCGPGLTTFDLLDRVGESGRVFAVDASPKMTAALKAQAAATQTKNLEINVQDAEALTPPPVALDGAFARWVLCFVERPGAVIEGVAHSLKQGGRFAAIDYFNYRSISLTPSDPLCDRVFAAVFDSFQNPGGGLDVGRRLPALLRQSGLHTEHIEPICAIGRPGDDVWHWVTDFLRGYLPKLVQRNFLTETERRRFADFWAATSANDDAFIFPPPMLGVVAIKT